MFAWVIIAAGKLKKFFAVSYHHCIRYDKIYIRRKTT